LVRQANTKKIRMLPPAGGLHVSEAKIVSLEVFYNLNYDASRYGERRGAV